MSTCTSGILNGRRTSEWCRGCISGKRGKFRSEIEKQSSRATSTDMFVSIVRKYTRARKLTPRMLNELVEKIEVYNAEKIDGEWVQRLRIH